MTIEQVIQNKNKNLNIHYIIRCLPLKELQRTRNWNGIKYDTFEEWFNEHCK